MSGEDENRTIENDSFTIKKRFSSENDLNHDEFKSRSSKKFKTEDLLTNDDDPVLTGSLRISNQTHDHHNDDSFRNWDNGSTDANGSLIDQSSLSHNTFQIDEESLGDVDVDGSDEESQYQPSWTSFSKEEAKQLKKDVKEKGLMKFIDKHIIQDSVPIAKMLEVFDIFMHPKAAMLASDIELLPILKSVVTRYLHKRSRLTHVNTLDDVAQLLNEANNIMIVTGAGVSVSCGIPDFRSETGIYSRLQEYELDDPQQMFDINYFRNSPEIFYSFAKELYPASYQPSPSHAFVKLIEDKGKLLRNYTQNIDTLEHKANIKRVVNCHGSFATASCVSCGYRVEGKEIESYIMEQKVPPCPKCSELDHSSLGEFHKKGLRIMKPDITFFGERLPAEFDNLLSVDTEQVDLLIVMGSSLKVSPVSDIMSQIPHRVPQILINRTPITHMTFDIQLLGDSDVIVPELCRMLNWDLRHSKLPGGTALSKESMRLSCEGPGDILEVADQETGQVRYVEHKIWKFMRDGLYTFPGAVVDSKYINDPRFNHMDSDGFTDSEDSV